MFLLSSAAGVFFKNAAEEKNIRTWKAATPPFQPQMMLFVCFPSVCDREVGFGLKIRDAERNQIVLHVQTLPFK